MKYRGVKNTLACVCVLGMCMLAGCGSDGATQADSNVTDSSVETSTENTAADDAVADDAEADAEIASGFVFESNGVEIAVDMDMSSIVDALGEPDSYFEQPSCAAQGIAKIYTYSGFQIETYPDGEQDLIASIILKDDSVSTPEGIDLSMTKDDIIAAYGSDYQETDKSITYENNGTKLCFILNGEDIASIEYDSPVLN
ncbi:MAG: hypothetical protein MR355_06335 [Lachnospiraceae bacterium]|nr:hypothetical protein [Lachnospiraceae bacterium]